MGLDNAMELPYWQDIDKYTRFTQRIYVVNRQLTSDEEAMTGRFIVNGSELRFKRYYTYGNETLVKEGFGEQGYSPIIRDQAGKVITPGQITLDDNSTYNLLLPTIVIIDHPVPPTSSSMMRYFIGQVLEKYARTSDESTLKTKIQKIMFGNESGPTPRVVERVIESYRSKSITFPELNPQQSMGYETEYETFAKTLKSGGKTKKSRSKRRKTRKLKRRSAKK